MFVPAPDDRPRGPTMSSDSPVRPLITLPTFCRVTLIQSPNPSRSKSPPPASTLPPKRLWSSVGAKVVSTSDSAKSPSQAPVASVPRTRVKKEAPSPRSVPASSVEKRKVGLFASTPVRSARPLDEISSSS